MKSERDHQPDRPMIGWRILATFVVLAIGAGLLELFSDGIHAAGLS